MKRLLWFQHISDSFSRNIRRVDERDWIAPVILLVILGGAFWHVRRYTGAVLDDAFITYRHTRNLISGYGFTCVPGERVEGTSTLAFAFVLLPFMALGADPYFCSVAIGSCAFVAMCIFAYRTIRTAINEPHSKWISLGAAGLIALSGPLAYHSQTGMETAAYAALIALAYYLHLDNFLHRNSNLTWAVVMGIAALTRIESVAYFIAWLIGSILFSSPNVTRRRAKRELVTFCIIFLPSVILRYAHFGRLVSTSALAKSGRLLTALETDGINGFAALSQGDGISLLRAFSMEHRCQLVISIGCLLLGRTAYALVPLSSLILGGAVLVNHSTGDWIPHYRHLTPSIAPLAVCTMLGLSGLLFHAPQRIRRSHWPSFALSGAIWYWQAHTVVQYRSIPKHAYWEIAPLKLLGERLAKMTHPDELVVTDSAGILPYYWGARVRDFDGLCDAHIAQFGTPQIWGTGRALPTYLFDQRPAWYAFRNAHDATVYYRNPAFVSQSTDYYWLKFTDPARYRVTDNRELPILLVRKDASGVALVKETLGANLIELGADLRFLENSP